MIPRGLAQVNPVVRAVRDRLARIHPANKRIAYGAAWVAAFLLAAKAAAAGRDMAIAWRYGVSDTVDAYQLAYTLVFWLPTALVAALLVVLVPALVKAREEDPLIRTQLVSELRGNALLTGGALAVVSVVLAIFALPYLVSGLSSTSHDTARQLVLGMAPGAVLTLIIGVHSARLMARQRQLNTLLEAVPALSILAFVLFWPIGASVVPLVAGTLLGVVLQTVLLSRAARKADDVSSVLRFSRKAALWPGIWRAAGVMAAGQLVMSFITPIDQLTAARLGDGAIATLGYAMRLAGLFVALGAVAFSRAALPVLAELYVQGQSNRARTISIKWGAVMLASGAVTAAIAWVLAPWMVGIVFERGAFNAADTAAVSAVFRQGLLQLPFYFVGLVFVQFLVSQGRYSTVAILAGSNLAVKLVLNVVLSSWMGVAGIALATSLMYAWSATCLYWAVIKSREATAVP